MVKAPDFDSGIRRFDSFHPCQNSITGSCIAWAREPFQKRFVCHSFSHAILENCWAHMQTPHPSHPTNHTDFLLFTGNANPSMAQEIAQHLGISLGAAHVGRFSDGEVTVEIQQNVRARDVFVVQSTCAPTNENLMELLIMVDALKRASAERISAVIPYFGYARQDRRPRQRRVPSRAAAARHRERPSAAPAGHALRCAARRLSIVHMRTVCIHTPSPSLKAP